MSYPQCAAHYSFNCLCCSFLRLFSNEQETWGGVCLDSAAKKLHVERRRIYDIVNVLESVEIVARRAKNKYAWFGMSRLPQAIERLRHATLAELNQEPAERQAAEAEHDARAATQSSIPSQFQLIKLTSPSIPPQDSGPQASETHCGTGDADSASRLASVLDKADQDSVPLPTVDVAQITQNQSSTSLGTKRAADNENLTDACSTEDEPDHNAIPKVPTQENTAEVAVADASHSVFSSQSAQDLAYAQFLEMYRLQKASRREKSLGVLSQKFVQLFLNSEHGVVSLEPAARRLLEEDTFNDEANLKTKIRRLYDIANILCSLNLVCRPSLAPSSP